MGDIRDLYEEAIRLYNAGDVEGFAAAHAQDAVLVTPVGIVRGRAAIRSYWTDQRAAFPDLTLRLGVVVEQGDIVAAEWTWFGTNTGPLLRRDGTEMRATGRRVELPGMELARIKDGAIVEYRMYWDGMAIARQLGLLPEQAVT
jgi:predicted ester cyclase